MSLRLNVPKRSSSFYVTEYDRDRDIADDYIVKNSVGEPGQFGKVYSCIRKNDKMQFAVKVIDKSRFFASSKAKLYAENFRAEIELLRKLDHPHIVQLNDVYENRETLMLVMELCCGGELFDRIADRAYQGGGYTERSAAMVIKQVLSAVAFMHSHDICHCDLKPANILFATKADDALVKVIDFGFAQRVPMWKRYLNKNCGTAYYMAPEVLKGMYNKEADLWSIGVIMFSMFFGYTPFQKASDERLGSIEENRAIKRRIRRGFKRFPKRGHVSSGAKGLIVKLLQKDTAKRYTAEEALMHPWFETASDDDEILDSVLKQLKRVSVMDNFKILVVSAIRDDEDLMLTQLMKYFEKFDVNKDKRISLREFEDGFHTYLPQLQGREVRQMFENLDIDGDHYIQFDEFWILVSYQWLINVYERLTVVFKTLDYNGDGYIDRDDIQKLKLAIEKDPLIRRLGIDPYIIIESADLDNDGRVSFEEFLFAMHPELVEEDMRESFERSKRLSSTPSRHRETDLMMESRRGRPRSQASTQNYEDDSDELPDKPIGQSSFDRVLEQTFSKENKQEFLNRSHYDEDCKNQNKTWYACA